MTEAEIRKLVDAVPQAIRLWRPCLLLLLFGSVVAPGFPIEQGGIGADDYMVYATVIAEIAEDRLEEMVILGHTGEWVFPEAKIAPNEKREAWLQFLREKHKEEVPLDTVEQYVARNKKEYRFRLFDLPRSYRLVDENDLKSLLKEGELARQAIVVSAVGYGKERESALVYIAIWELHGPCFGRGAGYFVLLGRTGSAWPWAVEKKIWVWSATHQC